MPVRRCVLLSALLCGFGASSQAGVIDFETGSFILGLGQSGRAQGFNFTAGGQPNSVLLVPTIAANCIPDCVSNGTSTLSAVNGATVTIDSILPGGFDLRSFDVAGTATIGSTRNATSMRVIGNLFGGGQVTQTFLIDPTAFQTLTLNSAFVNLSSAEFDGIQPIGFNSPEFQLDNIVYAAPSTTLSGVPEPASIVLIASVLFAAPFKSALRKRLSNQKGGI